MSSQLELGKKKKKTTTMDDDVECSFAVEYHGPPVSFVIPRVGPVDIRRIPVAVQITSSVHPSASIPVVQPFQLRHKNKKEEEEEEEGEFSPTSILDPDKDNHPSSPSQIDEDLGATRPVVTFDDDDDQSFCEKAESPEEEGKEEEEEEEEEEEDGSYALVVVVKKRGSCHRCGGGNVFTKKESCLVCNARFCFRCVLAAMGSMPEGRKCVSCIGRPVPESRRQCLGRSSRMLRRMLSAREFQQLMMTERCCEANQLRPEHVVVNRKPLSREEMGVLKSCSNPPSKLAPGRYWYDNVSGLWGKEGHKPQKLITPQLSIGGILMKEASNGNTEVFINGREITKTELKLLRYAGVHYAGCPNFWLNADGTYSEEGQKKIKGNLWNKPGTKFYCSILSLPIPSTRDCNSKEEPKNMCCKPFPCYIEERALRKLLLVGSPGSGTSTIFKQVRLLYRKPLPFSEEELENIKVTIQTNVYQYLGILLEGREHFEEEWLLRKREELSLHQQTDLGNNSNTSDQQNIYSISPRLKKFSDWFISVMEDGTLEAIFPAATREYAPTVEEFWKSPAIQATYNRRSELRSLSSAASYFLERIIKISRPEYKPSEMDIILCDGTTSSNGLTYTDFSLPRVAHGSAMIHHSEQHECPLRYQLIRVHTKGQAENSKWLEMFEDVRMVIFCVALTDYNEYYEDANGNMINKMLAARKLFESIVTQPAFNEMDFLLVLTKFDLLEQTIEQTPLTVCDWFNDFNPVKSRRSNSSNNNNGTSPAHQAFHYIAVKFKMLFASLTSRKLYAAMTNGLDSHSVNEVLRYASVIVDWEEERANFGAGESTAYTTEPISSH